MLVIGLTGGIASGKSTVANLFAQQGIDIIDADIIARTIVAPGSKNLAEIQQHFGKQVIKQNGELRRSLLRDLIFNNPTEKAWLEQLLHPQIRQRIQQQINQATGNYCIVVIPLLAETSPNPLIQRILVVDAEPSQQRQRLKIRDKLDDSQIDAILKEQASRKQRLIIADDIIKNDSDLNHLKAQVVHHHHLYQDISD